MTTKHFHNEPLYVGTKDLHHACEEHTVGAAMSRGDISEQWWADWLGALHLIHSEIDPEIDKRAQRTRELEMDISECDVAPRPNHAAQRLARDLSQSKKLREAAYYVITGAHLMGGQVMRVTLKGRVPDAHLQIEDRKELVELWSPMRQREDLVEEARSIFSGLLDIMDEILERDEG
jgi:hypothetical protein